jgi:hypothetical protein
MNHPYASVHVPGFTHVCFSRVPAFTHRMVPAAGSLYRSVADSPVQLTVAKPTVLLLNVSRDYNSTMHLIEGWLMSGGVGVFNRTVSVSLNGTLVFSGKTDSGGQFNFTRNLQPRNPQGQPTFGSATYTVEADFAGDTALNATAYSNTLDGTSYAACTTVQYGYKPSSNSTMLTVNPQSSQATTPTKTPQEVQKEAQDSGWLSVYNEWSWWYPWYRLHVKIHVNPTIDIGFNPILPGGETHNWDALEKFAAVTAEALEDIGMDLAGMFAAYITAKATSIINPAVGAVIEGVKLGVALAFLYNDWDNMVAVGATALVSIVMGLVAICTDVAGDFLLAVCNLIVGSAALALHWICDQLLHIVCVSMLITRWWIDAMEVIFDWIVGGLALAHYCGIL